MYRRLIIISVIILLSLCGLSWLGYHAISLQKEGLAGRRYAEFAAVAEQIRQDVKRKLDQFILTEQKRSYTDYQYYYVPDNVADGQMQQAPLLRSPLGEKLSHGLAYGYFQIDPGGSITAPFYNQQQQEETDATVASYLQRIGSNLVPVLNGSSTAGWAGIDQKGIEIANALRFGASRLDDSGKDKDISGSREREEISPQAPGIAGKKSSRSAAKQYKIESLQEPEQKEQVFTQQRATVEQNILNAANQPVALDSAGQNKKDEEAKADPMAAYMQQMMMSSEKKTGGQELNARRKRQDSQIDRKNLEEQPSSQVIARQIESPQEELSFQGGPQRSLAQSEMVVDESQSGFASDDLVQIRIEPFVPMLVSNGGNSSSIFGGDIFMVRHVQIEDRHFLQGFQLDQKKLIEEVAASARQFIRDGMVFALDQGNGQENVAYTAILDFGFGDLVLHLREIDPHWISRQIAQIQNWYFGIIGVVFVVVMLGVASLWRNVHAQLKLAKQKDDFISAVSHELRTPLTSIRMYTEMLEKDWIKTDDKRQEYYSSMRQESERLSRLIENVLDFSRIQRGKKKYDFKVGDINESVGGVVDMLQPYAQQHGFSLVKDFISIDSTTFDKDAVMQIAINLIDNAVKYAREAEVKTITVRTRRKGNYVLIEVEDHGPGVPHNQQQKIFEEFYRIGDESRRETTGTGLGLALVKKFALAHRGFVEVISAKPGGAIFRVALQSR